MRVQPNMVDTQLEAYFGPVIHAYTREQGIKDGVLIDVSSTAREAGFTIPVALTASVWGDCCEWDGHDAKRHYQDVSGRLWDVIWMARVFAGRNKSQSQYLFQVKRIPRVGRGRKKLVTLKCVIGPGDDGRPVITIMMPDED